MVAGSNFAISMNDSNNLGTREEDKHFVHKDPGRESTSRANLEPNDKHSTQYDFVDFECFQVITFNMKNRTSMV